ncbi:amidase [Jiangella anatolica]|uniref:Amidase n=1 Tax=Jiangella anatolica TaxID=2670374 RepID=A0A2W2BI26_9ACTN|nr:amidase [Jiangella anatolica]PZF79958.1 amidase [Jiangella anatolica]
MPTSVSRVRAAAGGLAAVALTTAILLPAAPTGAVTGVPAGNGATWQIHDAAPPGLDTGSIRAVSNAPAEGFGNIFVRVTGEPRLNGEMMRGWGLTYDGVDTFEPTRSVQLGDVRVTREVTVDGAGSWARFFDTFTNTGREPVTVEVSFGGSLGYGAAQNQGLIRSTSSGDAAVDGQDAWTLAATPNPAQRPVGVVLGTPGAPGTLDRTGNQQRDPFDTPMATTGHEANFQGYVSTLTVRPRQTLSLARFVTVGTTGAGAQAAAAEQLAALAAQPDLSGLTTLERCTLQNWDRTALGVTRCPSAPVLATPSAGPQVPAYTTSSYDVVNKSIDELLRDLEAGVTTSEEITRAYLDRIAVYDGGPLGYHAFIHVAEDAMQQARAADRARARGATGELLGIPIAIKDLYDTKDMPTTGGTLALEGWQPGTDAYQVERLRAAGAVIIGKANLSEFANSGGYSESGWGQVWNALYPSKTSFGSSGGSAVAVAAGLAAGALGSQTGVSLYAPSTGNSLTTFRGTDGMASLRGIMPLTWAQDYGGPIARTVTDLAHLLNATTGTDPLDPLTAEADAHRPADWTAHLDAGALDGMRIGYLPSSFVSSYADDGTGAAVMAHFADLEAAGATMVELTAPPSGGPSPAGSRSEEGWARYIELHDDFPYPDGDALLASPLVLPYNQRALRDTPRMTPEQVDAWLAYRANYKRVIAGWMDAADVDAVVYPGFLSDMYNNDASGNQLTADRATGVLTSNVGLPTVVVPVGVNPHGYSISMQLVGRAWDDAAILGMGYALAQQAHGQQLPDDAPPLEYRPNARPHAVPDISPLVPGRSPAAGLRGFGSSAAFGRAGENDG